jgi:hypothetical protein
LDGGRCHRPSLRLGEIETLTGHHRSGEMRVLRATRRSSPRRRDAERC